MTDGKRTQIGWGVWGAGAIAGRFAEALAMADGGRLTAVASRTEAKAQAFAARFGAETAADYAALLARADIDVVYIATPNSSHKDDALRAIAAGKAVLCEKPLCMSAADARVVAAAARAAGVFCMEGLWTHCIPAVQEACRLIASGAIGEVKSLTVSFGDAHAFDPASALFDPARGGGALLDRGVYAVSLAVRLLGSPTRLANERIMQGGVDVAADVLLRFGDTATATLGVSLIDFRANDMVISGTKGRLKLHDHITSPDALSMWTFTPSAGGDHDSARGAGLKARLKQAIKAAPALAPLRFLARQKLRAIPFRGNGMVHEIDEVHACLRAGRAESTVVPLSLSIQTLEVLDQLRA